MINSPMYEFCVCYTNDQNNTFDIHVNHFTLDFKCISEHLTSELK